MNFLKSFIKFFLIGLLVLSVFVGGIIGCYYAATVHWLLAIGTLVVYLAVIMGLVGMCIFELDLF